MEEILDPLPYPVTFVCRYPKKWPELFSQKEDLVLNPNFFHERVTTNEDCWTVMTYLHLKQRRLNVHISDRFIPGEICVVSGLDFGIRDRTFSSFIVACRSDGFNPALSDFTIVQNRSQVKSETSVFIHHWPQPGLIPRFRERGHHIKNIVFKGDVINLYESFRSSLFCQELDKLGVKLVISDKPTNSAVYWNDYSEADIVLAVRDLTEKDALVKPASKLINAWIAGVPALLGPEPAFRDLRLSPLDYIEVTTPEQALAAIQQLQQDPNLYKQMIANGIKRSEEFTVSCISQQWRDVLAGPVAQKYTKWCQRHKTSRMIEFIFKAFQQKISIAEAEYNRKHGYHMISGKTT
ncbi:glycosyltransferase [Aliinostoc sp. HNIBRCY26]|uniref:glycosyltransferase n=1 Tax=Aliinostoc sp. HNIBRCY26 TaxID=3418997 RepID=UPI003D01C7AE